MTWLNVASSEAARLIDERMRTDKQLTSTGLPSIDRAMFLWGDRRGIPQGSYVLVGGASNVGKTLFGLHLLMQAAKGGQRAGLVSLDMKNRDAIARLHQAMVPAIPLGEWRPSRWTEEHGLRLTDGLARYLDRLTRMAPDRPEKWGDVAIHEGRSRDLSAVAERIREGAEVGFTFFVVDHLQKIRVSTLRGDVYATADVVSETLDDLVDELDVTIVGLSQLNRLASRETTRRPTMFDLHGGTSMESNAAVVLMLDHSRAQMDTRRHNLIRTYVLLEKNQIGPKAIQAPVLVDAATLTVTEAMPDEEHLWPTAQLQTKRGAA
jgi:replicative DNA helicase